MTQQADIEYHDEVAERFDSSYDAHERYAAWWTQRAVNLVVMKSGVIPDRVIDIGCGTGRMAEAFAQTGHSVTAIDHSPGMLELASRRLSQHPSSKLEIVTDGVLPYTDKQFDLAFIFGVLHHVRGEGEGEDERLLREAARCAKVVFCAEPNILNPYFFTSTFIWHGLQEKVAGYPRVEHERPYRLPELRGLAEQSGLEILHSGNISAAEAYGGKYSRLAGVFKGATSSHVFIIAKGKV